MLHSLARAPGKRQQPAKNTNRLYTKGAKQHPLEMSVLGSN